MPPRSPAPATPKFSVQVSNAAFPELPHSRLNRIGASFVAWIPEFPELTVDDWIEDKFRRRAQLSVG